MAVASMVDLHFQSQEYGWKETYYRNGDTNLDNALTGGIELARARAMCLHSDAKITQVVASDIGVLQDSSVNKAVKYRGQAYKQVEMEPPDTALLVRLEATALYRRPLYMRGLPKTLEWPQSKGGDLATQFLSDSVIFRGILQNPDNNWCIKSVSKDKADRYPVTAIVVSANGVAWTTITGLNLEIAAKDEVRLLGFKTEQFAGAPPPNGIFQAYRVAAPSFDIEYTLGLVGYKGGAFIQVRKRNLAQITNVRFMRIVRRKTGQPVEKSKGRIKRRK